MIRKSITIGISNGLEARPIAMLVQVASQYTSNIYLESEARKVNAKSIMGIAAGTNRCTSPEILKRYKGLWQEYFPEQPVDRRRQRRTDGMRSTGFRKWLCQYPVPDSSDRHGLHKFPHSPDPGFQVLCQ